MMPEAWARLQELVSDALDAAPAEREGVLERAAAGDAELLAQARSLLGRRVDQGFLRPPVPGAAGAVVAETAAEGAIGRRFGPYRATGVIGSGGMGTVYRAVRDDDTFERTVAVKVLSGAVQGPGAQERFDRERRLLARLSHPNIAALLDGGRAEDGTPYLILEYVDGEAIDCGGGEGRGSGPGLPARRSIGLVRAICDAVAHAHQNLVIHRDLKPANILVTGEGVPKLVDFGISKLLDAAAADGGATLTRALTPGYASPEQLLGEPVTTATDIFAVGVILYELLTGRPPWPGDGGSALEVLGRSPPTPPSRLVPGLDGDLDAVCLKALALEPGERYASAAAMADDLDRVLTGRPVAARRPTMAYHARKLIARHKPAAALAAATLLLLICACVALSWMSVAVSRERDRVSRSLEAAERINAVLAATLEDVDSGAAAGKEITVGDLLAGAAARIDRELEDRPEAAGPLRITIARAYCKLGRLQDAGPQFDRGIAALRRIGPAARGALADALESLSSYHSASGHRAAAEAALEEAIALRGQARADPTAGPRLLQKLGNLRLESPGPDGGEALLAKAFEGFEAAGSWSAAAECVESLAAAAQARGDCSLARSRREEAVALWRQAEGGVSDRVAVAVARLGETCLACGDAPAAERELLESLEISRALHGPDHPTTTYQMMSLAAAMEAQGRPAEAEMQWTRSLSIATARLPEVHYITAVLRHKYGQFLTRQGRPEEAQRQLAAAYNDCVALLGADHEGTRHVGEAMIEALDGAGRIQEAAAWRKKLDAGGNGAS